uniref:Uncharacterized protein n=1 Tax=Plectus sambesii TaxID=2011161 RepID=A0A914VPS4_9BILA
MLMALRPKCRRLSLFWFTSLILAVSIVFANELDVYETITTNYNKNVRPVKHFSGPVLVSIELLYFNLLYMDQIQETITFMTTVDMIWKDENLIWNASKFNGTSSIVLPYYLLWKPDVFVSSGLNVEYMLPDEQRFLKVMSDGTVELLSLCSITNTCRMSIEAFPYDIQTCNITLESWMYTADQVDLVVGKKRGNMNATINDGNFLGNGEWTLVSFDKESYSYIASDGLPYAYVTYVVELRRQPIYYICVLLIPTFVTATICLFGLFVPAMNTGERVEKVNMGLTTLLSMAVLLGIVAGEMPKTTTLPLLGFYVLAELLLCTIGVFLSMATMTDSPYRLNRRFHKILQRERYEQIFGPTTHFFEYENSKSKSLAAAIERELYYLDSQIREIHRRQSELAYILEDLWLNEQASVIRAELNVLVALTINQKSALDIVRERRLTDLLIEIVDERNRLLMDLDVERHRDQEVNNEIIAEVRERWNRWASDGQTSLPQSTSHQSLVSSASAMWAHNSLERRFKRLRFKFVSRLRSFF